MQVRQITSFGRYGSSTSLPLYKDHVLFAGKVEERFECHEHRPGLGLIFGSNENDRLILNGQKISIPKSHFLLVNNFSRLTISLPKTDSLHRFLFFNSKLPGIICSSLTKTTEILLEEYAKETYDPDFAFLERVHPDLPWLEQTMTAIMNVSKSCSSFAALKADCMIRSVLESIIRENRSAIVQSENLSAIKNPAG